MTAIAAVDMALWDIKGKVLNTPVYNLPGGRSRSAVLVYGHANGRDMEETSDHVAKCVDLGYKAVRAQTGIPGLPSTHGPRQAFLRACREGPTARECLVNRVVSSSCSQVF
jgi:mannonate dehydratase